MTFRQEMVRALVERGVWADDAAKIVAEAEATKALSGMEGRWDEESGLYPQELAAICWMGVKDVALAHIDRNQPEAWYRPMFL